MAPVKKRVPSTIIDGAAPAPRAGTVAVVGRPNVGKSTLLNALVGADLAIISNKPETTRDSIRGIVTKAGTQFVYVDTPGMSPGGKSRSPLGAHMHAAARDTIDEAAVVLFVTEALRSPREREADDAILRGLPENKPIICVLNKVDLVVPRSNMLSILEETAKLRAFAAIVPVGARRRDGTQRIETEVQALLPEQEPEFEADELTDRPMRFFVAEYIREQILRQTHDEVPHGVAVTVDAYEEGKKAHRIAITIHVDRETHKPIVLGKGGERLKEIGTKARLRFEELSGQHVHLDVHVRVTPNWYDKKDQLAEFGYSGGDGRREPRKSEGKAS